jgi:hypothetical protein
LVPEMRVPILFQAQVPKNRRMARDRAPGATGRTGSGKRTGIKAR